MKNSKLTHFIKYLRIIWVLNVILSFNLTFNNKFNKKSKNH